MTLFAIFPSTDGVTNQLPVAMFKAKSEAESWAAATHGSGYRVKEIQIQKCDVVERTGLVWR